jgi:hypothetical protein
MKRGLAMKTTILTGVMLLGLALAAGPVGARVDVKVDYDKTFDFTKVKTWAWNAEQPGDVKMARTQEDDPEAMRQRAQPIILDAVGTEMGRRGLQAATAAPDVTAFYYLLLTTSVSAQVIGQFAPTTFEWGLPPIAGATQSFKVVNQGSLVLDISSAGRVVWRGVARAQIKMDADSRKRESLIREAARDLVKRFPPRS